MKIYFGIFIALICLAIGGCNPPAGRKVVNYKGVHFNLIKAEPQKGLLVLFPQFAAMGEEIMEEAPFIDSLSTQGISIIAMDISHLWVYDDFIQSIVEIIEEGIAEYGLENRNVYLGGMSNGGNMAVRIAHYIQENKSPIDLEGVFAVNSPLDLARLYRETSAPANDSNADVDLMFINTYLKITFGDPDSNAQKYQKISPYFSEGNHIENISKLTELKVRFYTEPEWELRNEPLGPTFEELNTQEMKDACKALQDNGGKRIELIETEKRAFRGDSARFPSSWSIVNGQDLLNWILAE